MWFFHLLIQFRNMGSGACLISRTLFLGDVRPRKHVSSQCFIPAEACDFAHLTDTKNHLFPNPREKGLFPRPCQSPHGRTSISVATRKYPHFEVLGWGFPAFLGVSAFFWIAGNRVIGNFLKLFYKMYQGHYYFSFSFLLLHPSQFEQCFVPTEGWAVLEKYAGGFP